MGVPGPEPVEGVWGSRSGMFVLMAGELLPRRMVSSSGVGGRGRLGPLAGTPTDDTLCSEGPELPTPEVLWGRNSRRGLGFRSLALMVPSLRTGPSSSELSSSSIGVASGDNCCPGNWWLEGPLLGTRCRSFRSARAGPGEGTRS